MTIHPVGTPIHAPSWCKHHVEVGTITRVYDLYSEAERSSITEYRISWPDGSWCYHGQTEIEIAQEALVESAVS